MEIEVAPHQTAPRAALRHERSSVMGETKRGDFLRIELGGGRAVETIGELERRAEAPEDGWAFYCNDFELSDAKPWLVAENVQFSLPWHTELPAAQNLLKWQEPEFTPFKSVFDAIFEEMATHGLLKAVPAVTAKSPWNTAVAPQLLSRCFRARGDVGSHAYGYEIEGRGAAGLTPEVLFRMEDGILHTMALAGTVPQGLESDLETSEKLRHEHEMVVASLVERLTPLGELRRDARRLMPLNGMTHLCTKLRVVLDDANWLHRTTDLISLLHPTPALGVAPRNAASLKLLGGWRKDLGVPSRFGAPLGVKWPGGMLMLVAIRGVFWEHGQAYLPSGCGIVAGSEAEAEWAELSLKRRWVRNALGC
jgi:menaquinone-specific isochorismate synthase